MAKKFVYPDMNNFKYLTAGCLVCGLIPPNMAAHGLTPRVAVCDLCWTTKPQESIKALDEALQPLEPESDDGDV